MGVHPSNVAGSPPRQLSAHSVETSTSDAPLRGIVVVGALAVTLFAYVTVEALPIGLLPQISSDLGVSHSATGYLVTVYAIVVMATSVPLTQLTRNIRRRPLLCVLIATFTAATLLCALAPNYAILLVARVVVALTHAVFWSVIAVAATGMFAPRLRSRVVAGLFSGASLASVIGVPTGTWLGQLAGWQLPFLVMSALGLLSLVVVMLCLPSTPVVANPASQAPNPSRRRFWIVMTGTAATVTGVFTFHTYVTVFLTSVSGVPNSAISAVLLAAGAAGIAGTVTAGGLANRWPRMSTIGAVAGLGTVLTALAVLGTSTAAAVACVALMGFFIPALVTTLQNRILLIAPKNVDVASAAGSATFNSGIAFGAFLGGRLLESSGAGSVAAAGAVITGLGLVVLSLENQISSYLGRQTHDGRK